MVAVPRLGAMHVNLSARHMNVEDFACLGKLAN